MELNHKRGSCDDLPEGCPVPKGEKCPVVSEAVEDNRRWVIVCVFLLCIMLIADVVRWIGASDRHASERKLLIGIHADVATSAARTSDLTAREEWKLEVTSTIESLRLKIESLEAMLLELKKARTPVPGPGSAPR